MPEFSLISREEAMLRTAPTRRKPYFDEYRAYLTQLRPGRAGKLSANVDENVATLRRRIGVVAKDLGLPLTIKRRGNDIYFWYEQHEAAPARRRGRRGGRAGGIVSPVP
jgi:hypothetical protein